MSESFKRSLRSKSAEQLTNMSRNRESWSDEEYRLIQEEVSNRGLEIFEEPEEWSDEVMEKVDLIEPKTDFERNLAYLAKDNEKVKGERGIGLASQILSIASMIVAFGFFYWCQQFNSTNGLTLTMQLSLGATLVGITGLILFIVKSYIPSIIISSISLLISLLAMGLYLIEML